MKEKLLIGIQEKPKTVVQWVLLSFQHVFAMFGATILVPVIVNGAVGYQVLTSGVALVASGIGTLIYIAFTRAKVPVYLGSSFAYIGAMITAALSTHESVFVGLMAVGLVYAVIATVIKFTGSQWLKKLLPPVVIGPVIIIIGLSLAPFAIADSGLDSASPWQIPVVALITFTTVVIVSIFTKGFVKVIPFLIAILVGYVAAVILGVVDLQEAFSGVGFLTVPEFKFFWSYKWDFSAVIMFLPLALVTIAEHIGDHTVLGEICEEDFITDPGLDKTIMGDGVATFVSAAIGGPANTTYGENTGVVAMTKVGSVYVTGLAAVFAILLGFIDPINAFIVSIPTAVLGGMTLVLYGLIAGNGVKVLVKAKVNLGALRNLIIVSTMLVVGLGGAIININEAADLKQMSLAAIVGIFLNLVLPKEETE